MRSLTKESASGFAWLLAQSGSARVLAFLAQILLARLLRPADFGEVALVSSLAAIVATLAGFGVDEVVLSRSRRFRMWVAPAFWVSLSFSVLGALTLLTAAPIAAHFYHSSAVKGMLAILALSMPLASMASIPNAYLRSNLRFRFTATYATVELLTMQTLIVLLAWRGFGAFSFVIPTPLAAAARALVFWQVARPPANWHIRRRQLRILVHSGFAVCGQKLITSLRENGDYLLLGMVASKSSVGLYFMAFKLAAAPVYTLVNSMYGVLFPALAQLRGETARQRAAVLNASRAIALTVIPLSFLLAAVSVSLLHLVFGPKWTGAAAMLSILTVGLAFDVIPCVASALMTANGKFKAQWMWSAASIPFFFLFIGVGCSLGGAVGVALGVAFFFIIGAPCYSYFALRSVGCSLRDVAGIYLPPTLCSAGAVGFGLLMSHLPQIHGRNIAMMAVICAFTLVSYSLSVRWVSPVATRDAMQKISLMWSRA